LNVRKHCAFYVCRNDMNIYSLRLAESPTAAD